MHTAEAPAEPACASLAEALAASDPDVRARLRAAVAALGAALPPAVRAAARRAASDADPRAPRTLWFALLPLLSSAKQQQQQQSASRPTPRQALGPAESAAVCDAFERAFGDPAADLLEVPAQLGALHINVG